MTNSISDWQVRHDYLRVDAEGEHEDAGHRSVGFDGRDHRPTLRALRIGREVVPFRSYDELTRKAADAGNWP